MLGSKIQLKPFEGMIFDKRELAKSISLFFIIVYYFDMFIFDFNDNDLQYFNMINGFK